MINRGPPYNQYLLMLEDCINPLSLTVKSESLPKAFEVWEVEIHKFCFSSLIDVERAKDLVYINILDKKSL